MNSKLEVLYVMSILIASFTVIVYVGRLIKSVESGHNNLVPNSFRLRIKNLSASTRRFAPMLIAACLAVGGLCTLYPFVTIAMQLWIRFLLAIIIGAVLMFSRDQTLGAIGLVLCFLSIGLLVVADSYNELAVAQMRQMQGTFCDERNGIRISISGVVDAVGNVEFDFIISNAENGTFTSEYHDLFYFQNDEQIFVQLGNYDNDADNEVKKIRFDDNGTIIATVRTKETLVRLEMHKYVPSSRFAFFDITEKAASELPESEKIFLERLDNETYSVHFKLGMDLDQTNENALMPGKYGKRVLEHALKHFEGRPELSAIYLQESFTATDGQTVAWEAEWNAEQGLRVISNSASGYRVEKTVRPLF